MFFFLSKTLNYLAQPLVIVFLVFLTGLLIRNQRYKKWLLRASVILLLFFSNQFIAVKLMSWWETPLTPFDKIEAPYDYGILLTGITRAKVGPEDRVYFSRGADRVTHTLQLYKKGLIRKIIVSGGSGRLIDIGVREADELASFLVLAGVPETDILIENESDNTYQSAILVARLLGSQQPAPRLLLISSAYHLPRAGACFKKAGLETTLFATDPVGQVGNYTLDMFIIPKPEGLGIWQALLKEWVGMIAYWLAGYI